MLWCERAHVVSHMMASRERNKIFNPVIGSIAVDVVNNLIRLKFPPIRHFPYLPMFGDVAQKTFGARLSILTKNVDIAIDRLRSAAVPVWVGSVARAVKLWIVSTLAHRCCSTVQALADSSCGMLYKNGYLARTKTRDVKLLDFEVIPFAQMLIRHKTASQLCPGIVP